MRMPRSASSAIASAAVLAYLAATRTDADAAVGYYGGGIDNFLGESHAIGKPLLLHFAGNDAHIDAPTARPHPRRARR